VPLEHVEIAPPQLDTVHARHVVGDRVRHALPDQLLGSGGVGEGVVEVEEDAAERGRGRH
jgi:hypothetical protein